MERETVNPSGAFNTLQHGFSQAVTVGDGRRICLSGQVAVDEVGRTTAATLGAQLEDSIDNVARILAAAGAGLEHVTMLRLYIVEAASSDLAPVAEVLRRRFPEDPPASTWLVVSGLARKDWLVEVEAEAVM